MSTALLFLASLASASTLTASGVCPGDLDVEVTGLTPGGRAVLLYGTGRGAELIGPSPCEGARTSLAGHRPVTVVTVDPTGAVRWAPTVERACGRLIQVLDVATCTLSNVETLDGEEPDFGNTIFAADSRAGNGFGLASWQWHAIDLDAGTVTTLADLPAPITGLDVGPDGQMYAVQGGSTYSFGTPELYTVDAPTGALTPLSTLADDGSFSGFAWGGDALYGWTESGDDLVVVDPLTGAVTPTGFGAPSGNNCTASSADGRMYRIFRGQLFQINYLGASETPLGSISGMLGTDGGQGCTFHNGELYFATGTPKTLYTLDLGTRVARPTGIVMPDGVDALGSFTK